MEKKKKKRELTCSLNFLSLDREFTFPSSHENDVSCDFRCVEEITAGEVRIGDLCREKGRKKRHTHTSAPRMLNHERNLS